MPGGGQLAFSFQFPFCLWKKIKLVVIAFIEFIDFIRSVCLAFVFNLLHTDVPEFCALISFEMCSFHNGKIIKGKYRI